MKIIYLLFLPMLLIYPLYSSENYFENSFELYGISGPTDQVIMSSPDGDDYFLCVEKNHLISRRRGSNDDIFLDYIPDFSFHSFDTIYEVEKERVDNNRDILIFIGEERGIPSLNIMGFNQHNQLEYIEELQVNFNFTDDISNLQVMDIDRFTLKILYMRNSELYSRDISLKDMTITKEIKTGVVGEIVSTLDNYTVIRGKKGFELWYIGVNDDRFNSKYIKTLTEIEVQNLEFTFTGSRNILSTTDDNTVSYIDYNSQELTFKEYHFQMGNTVRLYRYNRDYFYGLSVKDDVISIEDFTTIIPSDQVEVQNQFSYYVKDEFVLLYNPSIMQFSYYIFDEDKTYTIDLDGIRDVVLIDNTLIILLEEENISILKRFYLCNSGVLELKDNKSVYLCSNLSEIEYVKNFIHIKDSNIYYSFEHSYLFESTKIPYWSNGYILYLNKERFIIGNNGYVYE